jgi:hypothetical protein
MARKAHSPIAPAPWVQGRSRLPPGPRSQSDVPDHVGAIPMFTPLLADPSRSHSETAAVDVPIEKPLPVPDSVPHAPRTAYRSPSSRPPALPVSPTPRKTVSPRTWCHIVPSHRQVRGWARTTERLPLSLPPSHLLEHGAGANGSVVAHPNGTRCRARRGSPRCVMRR